MSFNDLLAKETAVKTPQKETKAEGRKPESQKKEPAADQWIRISSKSEVKDLAGQSQNTNKKAGGNLTQVDFELLRLLIKTGPHRFPLFSSEDDDRATLHAESLVARGLVERAAPLANTGTTYAVTWRGRYIFDQFAEQWCDKVGPRFALHIMQFQGAVSQSRLCGKTLDPADEAGFHV